MTGVVDVRSWLLRPQHDLAFLRPLRQLPAPHGMAVAGRVGEVLFYDPAVTDQMSYR